MRIGFWNRVRSAFGSGRSSRTRVKAFRNLKPDQFNPIAREAFGKTLIDLGLSLFRALTLLFTVVPLALLMKGAFDGTGRAVTGAELIALIDGPMFYVVLTLVSAATIGGLYFQSEGLRHLHEIEDYANWRVPRREPAARDRVDH